MKPESTYRKRLRMAALQNLGKFWSSHRLWVTFSAFVAPFLIQANKHGWCSLLTFAETAESAVLALGLSILGNIVIALYGGTKTLDNELRGKVNEQSAALLKLSQDTERLRKQLEHPPLSPIEQGRRDLVKQVLESFPTSQRAMANVVLKHVSQHGEVDLMSLISGGILGGLSNPHLVSEVINTSIGRGLLKVDAPSRRLVWVNPDLKSALLFYLLGE